MTNPPDQITIPLLHTVHTLPSQLHSVRSIFVVGEREVTLSTFPFPHTVASCLVPPTSADQPPWITSVAFSSIFFFPILLFIFYAVLVLLHFKCLSWQKTVLDRGFNCIGLFSWLMVANLHAGLHVTWYWILGCGWYGGLEIFCCILNS